MQQISSSDAPSLLLRCTCRHCQQLLHLPVRQLNAGTHSCPHCLSDLDLPELEQIDGLNVLLSRASDARMREVPCAGCGRTLELSVADIGKHFRCFTCHAWLALRLVSDRMPSPTSSNGGQAFSGSEDAGVHRNTEYATAPNEDIFSDIIESAPPYREQSQPRSVVSSIVSQPDDMPEVAESDIFSDVFEQAEPERFATNDAPSKSSQSSESPRSRRPPPIAPPPEFEDEDEDVDEDDLPPLIIDNEHSHLSAREPEQHSRSLFHSPRLLFWLIFPFLLVAPLMIALCSGSPPLILLAIAWDFFFWWVSWLLAWFVVSLLITSFRCPHCELELEAVGRWSCSCGYNDHRDRHFLRFKCPLCKARLGRTDCPRCHATIIMRK